MNKDNNEFNTSNSLMATRSNAILRADQLEVLAARARAHLCITGLDHEELDVLGLLVA